MSGPMGIQNLPVTEFRWDPSLRIVDSFFLGALFLLAANYIIKSPAVLYAFGYLSRPLLSKSIKSSSPPSLESLESDADEKLRLRRWVEDVLLGPAESLDPKNLVFMLCIFAANASIALAGSAFIFAVGQDIMCTFLVAWGGLSAEMIRVMGFIRISLELHSLHTRQWEMYITWFYMFIVIGLMLFKTAVESGILRTAPGISNMALCYRQHSMVASLLYGGSNLLFELYSLIRLVTLLAPSFLTGRHRLGGITDIRIGMVLSLFLLDALTVVPEATAVSIAADYIPFSVAAIIVLIVFNREHISASSTLSRVDSIPSTRMMEISRRDYDAMSFRTVRTSRSRSLGRRSTSVTNRNRRRDTLPPFNLADVAADNAMIDNTNPNSARSLPRKKSRKNLAISVGGQITPNAANALSPRTSSVVETQESMGQILTAQRAVRPWPNAPAETPGQDAAYPTGIPPPPTQPPPVPPTGFSRRSRFSLNNALGLDTESRTSVEVHPASANSSAKRRYDPSKDTIAFDGQRRRNTLQRISPGSAQDQQRWPYWPVPEEAENAQAGTSQPSRRQDKPTRSRKPVNYGGAALKRASLDLAAPTPNIMTGQQTFSYQQQQSEQTLPLSPSTAPVSRMAIGSVLSPGFTAPSSNSRSNSNVNAIGAGYGAVGTGGGLPAETGTRVRFGARPMRSAALLGGAGAGAGGRGEDSQEVMPRGMLQPMATSKTRSHIQSARGFDRYQ